MPLWKTKKLDLSETVIRYAMKHTKTAKEAAAFLGVASSTFKKSASLYVDPETGKTLYQLHKGVKGKGIILQKDHASITDILDGKYPNYRVARLKSRLIKEGYLAEECVICGFAERRVSDYTVPLLLAFKDGNKKNFKLENLETVCYNCYYLCYGRLKGKVSEKINCEEDE
jgi:hypothetical protein